MGEDIVSAKHARSSISHQHVLAPDDRSIDGAAPIMRQMLVRAAQRLRDDGYGSTNLEFERRRTPELARVRVIEVSIRVTPRSTTDRIVAIDCASSLTACTRHSLKTSHA